MEIRYSIAEYLEKIRSDSGPHQLAYDVAPAIVRLRLYLSRTIGPDAPIGCDEPIDEGTDAALLAAKAANLRKDIDQLRPILLELRSRTERNPEQPWSPAETTLFNRAVDEAEAFVDREIERMLASYEDIALTVGIDPQTCEIELETFARCHLHVTALLHMFRDEAIRSIPGMDALLRETVTLTSVQDVHGPTALN